MATPKTAVAYTDAEIAAYVKQRLSCSAVFPEKTQPAQVRGTPERIQVFRFLLEYCGGPGAQNPGATFAAVARGPNGITLLLPKPMQFKVEGFTFADGYLVATSSELAPGDPACCPSRRSIQRWVVSGNGFIPAP